LCLFIRQHRRKQVLERFHIGNAELAVFAILDNNGGVVSISNGAVHGEVIGIEKKLSVWIFTTSNNAPLTSPTNLAPTLKQPLFLYSIMFPFCPRDLRGGWGGG